MTLFFLASYLKFLSYARLPYQDFPTMSRFQFYFSQGAKGPHRSKVLLSFSCWKSPGHPNLSGLPLFPHKTRHVHRVPVSSLRQMTDALDGTREASKCITVSTRRCRVKMRDPHTWEQEAFPQLPLPLEQTHTHFLNQNTIRNLTHDFSRLVILPICEMVYTVTKFKQHVLCFQ